MFPVALLGATLLMNFELPCHRLLVLVDIAACVKAVVAMLPLLSPEDLVGAVGVPMNTGLFNGASSDATLLTYPTVA